MLLSYSQIDSYLRCPERYRYAYIEKIPQYLHKSMTFGTSVHNALYAFMKEYLRVEQIRKQQTLFEEDIAFPDREYLLQCLDDSWIETGYRSKEEMYDRKKEAITLLTEFYHSLQHPTILLLETSFTLPVGSHMVKGRWDRVDAISSNMLHIIDYKTGKIRVPSSPLQMHLYILALQERFPKHNITAELYFVEHNQREHIEYTQQSLQETKETVQHIGDSVENTQFHATPSPANCDSCSYSSLCKYSLAGR